MVRKGFKPSVTGRYRVKPHHPWRHWAILGVAAIAGIVVVWSVYEFGQYRGGFNRASANSEIQDLVDQIGILNTRIDELTMENAQLASNSVIDATANKQVSEKLRDLNEQILELKEELVFYRSLLTPADLEPGLQILGMQLFKGASEHIYNYKIVLTQRRNRNRYASGNVELQVSGSLDGQTVQLGNTELLPVEKSRIKFRVKNFLSLEGQLTLPNEFSPEQVIVNIKPKSSSLKKVERQYAWNTIVTGG